MASITIRQAIESYFDFEISENLITKIVIDTSLNEDAVYSSSDLENVELAVATLCGSILLLKSFGEGGLKMDFDRGALKEMRRNLLIKYGKEDELNDVSTISANKPW